MNTQSILTRKQNFKPKGLLVAIGGNEDKEYERHILSTILSLVKKQRKNIEIITRSEERRVGKEC